MKSVAFSLPTTVACFLAPSCQAEEALTPAKRDVGLPSVAPVSPVKEVRAEDDESIESGGAVEEKTQEETTNRVANENDAAVTGSVCVSNEALQSQPVEATCTLEVLVKHTRERVGENIARHSGRSVKRGRAPLVHHKNSGKSQREEPLIQLRHFPPDRVGNLVFHSTQLQ